MLCAPVNSTALPYLLVGNIGILFALNVPVVIRDEGNDGILATPAVPIVHFEMSNPLPANSAFPTPADFIAVVPTVSAFNGYVTAVPDNADILSEVISPARCALSIDGMRVNPKVPLVILDVGRIGILLALNDPLVTFDAGNTGIRSALNDPVVILLVGNDATFSAVTVPFRLANVSIRFTSNVPIVVFDVGNDGTRFHTSMSGSAMNNY
jgi:hypothetical protein